MSKDVPGFSIFRNKLVQFVLAYWLILIGLTKLGGWLRDHHDDLAYLFKVTVIGLLMFGGLITGIYLYRRTRQW